MSGTPALNLHSTVFMMNMDRMMGGSMGVGMIFMVLLAIGAIVAVIALAVFLIRRSK
jgi:uncharacterized membrane protein